MNMRKYIASTLFVGAVVFPGVSQAFELIDTAAYQVTPDTYLMTIEYELGYLNAEAYTPIAPQGRSENVIKPHLSYELQREDGTAVTDGQLVGIILSDDGEVKNRYYHVEAGKRETFTLLALYRVSDSLSLETPLYLQVTSLGNVVDTGTKTSYIAAAEEQLAGFRVTLPSVVGK